MTDPNTISPTVYIFERLLIYSTKGITVKLGKEINPELIKFKPTSPPFSNGTTIYEIKRKGHKGYSSGWLGPSVDQWRQRENEEREREAEVMMKGTGHIDGEQIEINIKLNETSC